MKPDEAKFDIDLTSGAGISRAGHSVALPRVPGWLVCKYQNDVVFHTLVDSMENLLHNGNVTPADLSYAATLAATVYGRRHLLDDA